MLAKHIEQSHEIDRSYERVSRIITGILKPLPPEYDLIKKYIISNDLDKLAEYSKKYYKPRIKKLLLPLIHRRNLEYGDTYQQISDVSKALRINSKKFHSYDAELIKEGFYDKQLLMRSRTDLAVSTAEKEILGMRERGIIDQAQLDEILSVISKLIKIHRVVSLKKNQVNIMLVISISLVTGEEIETVMRLLNMKGNASLSYKIIKMTNEAQIEYGEIPGLNILDDIDRLEEMEGEYDLDYS